MPMMTERCKECPYNEKCKTIPMCCLSPPKISVPIHPENVISPKSYIFNEAVEDPTELWNRITDFNDEHWPDWRTRDPFYLFTALFGELGEAANAFKHSTGGGTNLKETKDEYIANAWIEMVDAFIYWVLVSERIGLTKEMFTVLFNTKLKILEKRLSPKTEDEK